MNKKVRELSSNTLLFTISNFGSKVVSFLMVPLYTAVLSTEQFGVIDLLSTTVQLLIPIFTLNIQDAVLRFTIRDEFNKGNILNTALQILFFSSLGLSVLMIILSHYFDNNYLAFLFFSFVFGSLYNISSMYLKATNKVKIIAIFGIAQTVLICLLNIIFLIFIPLGENGFFIANTLGFFLCDIGIIYYGKLYKLVKIKLADRILFKRMISFSVPLVINSISWWVNNASDRYILTFFCGASVNGIYSAAYKVPTIVTTIQSIFYNAWSISAIKEFDPNDQDSFLGRVYSIYSVTSIFLCSILILCNKLVSRILFAGEFYIAWKYVPFLLCGAVFNGLALFLGCFFTATNKTKDISSTTLVGAVINILLNVFLIPLYGGYGAAFATLVGYLITWITRTVKLRKIIKLKVNWKFHIISLILLVIQSILAVFYNNEIIGIAILVLILMLNKSNFAGMMMYIRSYFLNSKKAEK